MATATLDDVAEVKKKLAQPIKTEPVTDWDGAWKAGITPWDSGDVQPPLRDLVLSNELDLPKIGRALVPGCGRGYDAVFFASHLGLDILAIDISPTAIQAARDHIQAQSISSGALGAKVSFELANFFELSVQDDQRFSLIYDYSFFVAILPAQRGQWGKQMSALLKPGGYLLTLVYPLSRPENGDGPPFVVTPEHYVDVLGKGWEKVLDKVPKISLPHHEGRERLIVYKKL